MRIVTLKILVDLHSVKLHVADHISRLLIHVRLDPLHGRHLLHPFAHSVFIHFKRLGKRLYHLLRFLDLAVDHRYGTYRLVGRKHFPLRVQDLPPCRLDLPLPLMQVLSLLLIIFCVKYHQIYKPSYKRKYNRRRAEKYYQDLLLIICLILHNIKTSQKLFL